MWTRSSHVRRRRVVAMAGAAALSGATATARLLKRSDEEDASSSDDLDSVAASRTNDDDGAAATAIAASGDATTATAASPTATSMQVAAAVRPRAASCWAFSDHPAAWWSRKPPTILATSVAGRSTGNRAAVNDSGVDDDDDGYPAFTPHHRSLLKEYLTRDLWRKLKDRKTKNGVTLEDVIKPGLALPYASDPPRRVGVLAGDADSYRVFAPLFDAIIRKYHNVPDDEYFEDPEMPSEAYLDDDDLGGDFDDIDEDEPPIRPRLNLRRQCTVINNPLGILKTNPDPDDEKYILSTRIRVARSIDGIPFATTISRADRRKVERLVVEAVGSINSPELSCGLYLPLLSMTNEDNDDLIQRHILFDNPDEWAMGAGLGRDWPDGRGIYINVTDTDQTPDFMVWCNEEDHIRLICLRKGGDIRGVFATLSGAVREMEAALRARGHQFAYDDRLGYLTSCPTNIGTALRASVHVKLMRLGRLPGFDDMVRRMKLEARGKHGELDRRYTGIFDISNAERLGKSEVHLINVMIDGVARLIELERKLERGEEVDCDKIAR